MILSNKKILVGITGCIASYKSAEIVRRLKKLGADVWVIMTKAAAEFITPLTFRTISGNPCITDMFDANTISLPHISLTDDADLLLIVPATANILAKAANGIGDDLLSTVILSSICPKIFAPAMNSRMWGNKIVEENVKKLKNHNMGFVGPIDGVLACGEIGIGHIAEINGIVDAVVSKIGIKQDFAGKKILITAGGTREGIDPVRFIGNRSSGKMGYAIAREAVNRGAEVTLISANVQLEKPDNVLNIMVENAENMDKEVFKNVDSSDIVIMSAAVSDYRPSELSAQKIKKDKADKTIHLEPVRDILKKISLSKKNKILVGFSVESKDLIGNSARKLKDKKLDLIIANDISAFESDVSNGAIISKDGDIETFEKMKKIDLAEKILNKISSL